MQELTICATKMFNPWTEIWKFPATRCTSRTPYTCNKQWHELWRIKVGKNEHDKLEANIMKKKPWVYIGQKHTRQPSPLANACFTFLIIFSASSSRLWTLTLLSDSSWSWWSSWSSDHHVHNKRSLSVFCKQLHSNKNQGLHYEIYTYI